MSERVAELIAITGGMRGAAKRLAVSIGNFHGTNDFARTKPDLDCGFILNDLQRDLIDVVLVRCYAVLIGDKPTDATLTRARKLLSSSDLREDLALAARGWTLPTKEVARERAARMPERLDRFLRVVATLDFDAMRSHRNWVLAHSTTNTPPPVTFISVWDAAASILQAYDDLYFVAFGEDPDVSALADTRREQAKFFWDNIRAPLEPAD